MSRPTALLRFACWILLAALPDATAAEPDAGMRPYADWKAACDRLPSNRALQGSPVPAALLPLPRFAEFADLLAAFARQSRAGALGNPTNWVGEAPTDREFFNTDTAYFLHVSTPGTALVQGFLRDARRPAPAADAPKVRFQPFALKLDLPPGAEVFLHADLHGDVRSLLADLAWLNTEGYLEGFRIRRPGFHMVFFGDYIDRGHYGIEVLYTLLRLKLANPDRVFLGRGNHEEASLAARYGFLSEGRLKYGSDFDAQAVLRAFDFLPVAIFCGVGGRYAQCHHGGLEPGYDPRALLDAPGPQRQQFLGTLNQRQFLGRHPDWFPASDAASRQAYLQHARDFRPDDPIHPTVLGFQWNDFSIVAEEPGFAVDPGRAFVYGKATTQGLLARLRTDRSAIHAIFRGHQQASALTPMMRRLVASRGVFRHWQAGDSTARMGAGIPELAGLLEVSAERAIPEGSVWTLNISPDSSYGQACGFTYDAFGILRLATQPSDWRLRVVNVDIPF